MAILDPLPADATSTCRLCPEPASGVLSAAAVVDPWLPEERTAPVVANLRRVLARNDALCERCGAACSYDIGGD
jgi:hypothetical protein